MSEFMQDNEEIMRLMEGSRLRSAKSGLEQLLSLYPVLAPPLLYQYGVFNRSYLGNGVEARRLFIEAVESIGKDAAWEKFDAYASENLMLLSLSFEEYYSWAERLRQKQPESPIVLEQEPQVRRMEEGGLSWVDVLHCR